MVEPEVTAPPTKTVEELEREMLNWVGGIKDDHDLTVEALKGQSVVLLQARIAGLKYVKQMVVRLTDRAIDECESLLRHTQEAEAGHLKIEDGKVVGEVPVLSDVPGEGG